MPSITYIHSPCEGYSHTHTVIFLHGRDSDAYEFASEFFESEASISTESQRDHQRSLPALFPTIRWVFPAAPILRSQRFETDMSQWFDMWAVEDPEEKSETQRGGLSQSIKSILHTIRSEEEIVPRHKIFLGGISQGFATALAIMFADGQGGFAGLMGLCSWLPFASRVETEMAVRGDPKGPDIQLFTALQKLYYPVDEEGAARLQPSPAQIKSTPVFAGHAIDDDVVPVENARRMKKNLSHLGLEIDWHEYEDGGHWFNEPQGANDMVRFIKRHM